MLKEENSDFKTMLIGFGVFFLYFIMSALAYDFISIFGIRYNDLSLTLRQIYLILYEIITLIIIVFIYKKDVISNFKKFVKNIKNYIKKYIKYWIIALILMIISNMIVTIFTYSDMAANQKIVLEEFKLAPIYTFIATIIISPIMEELVFRLSFRKMFKHTNILFIFFSGFVFGFIHVIGTLSNLNDLLFIIPYSIPGFIFAYAYTKSKNICVPIMLHLIHNLFMFIIQIILIII